MDTFWAMSLFWQPEPDIFFDLLRLGSGVGFVAEAVFNCEAHGSMCCGGSILAKAVLSIVPRGIALTLSMATEFCDCSIVEPQQIFIVSCGGT